MEQIKAEMKSLQSLYGKATLTTFDDSGDHDEQINDAAQHITVLFRKAEKRLQEFSREASASEADEKVGGLLPGGFLGRMLGCGEGFS